MAVLDNLPRLLQNSDVGIKISKPYYDAVRTQPQNLIFSSSWPSLPIAKEIDIPDATALSTYSVVTGGRYAVPHGLGYPPLAFYWQLADISGKAGAGNVWLRAVADADKTNVYISPPQSIQNVAGVTPPINIKCFAIDLRQDVDYPTPTGDNLPSAYDPDYGIKVSKPNKSVDSKDLRDFILHSRAQSPLILAVKTEQTSHPSNPASIQYTNKSPYPVWVYGFARQLTSGVSPIINADYFRYAPYYQQTFPKTNTDGFVSTITFNPGANGATLVILRDPMFAATRETVQY